MEKKHISDFSIEELEIFENFVKNFKTIGGLEYNLAILKMDKEYGLGLEWITHKNQEEKNDNNEKEK